MRQEAGLRGRAEGELLSQKVPYESPPRFRECDQIGADPHHRLIPNELVKAFLV